MKMLLFVVVMVTVAIAEGEFGSRSDVYCCSPEKWSNIEWAVGGASSPSNPEGVGVRSLAVQFYDRKLKKYAYVSNTTIGITTKRLQVLEDWGAGVKYIADLDTNRCVTSRLPTHYLRGCIPKTSKEVGRFYYGMKDTNVMNVTLYSRVLTSPTQQGTEFVGVDNSCVFVTQTFVGKLGKTSVSLSIYDIQTTPEIPNPGVFNIPPACQKSYVETKYTPLYETLYGWI